MSNKLEINQALIKLKDGLKDKIADFEKKVAELKKAEALAKDEVAKNALEGYGDMAMSEEKACKLCGDLNCNCDAAEKYAKSEPNTEYDYSKGPGKLPGNKVPEREGTETKPENMSKNAGMPGKLPVGHTLPASPGAHPALAAVGQPVKAPAKVPQTMVERVASKMPSSKPKLPGIK